MPCIQNGQAHLGLHAQPGIVYYGDSDFQNFVFEHSLDWGKPLGNRILQMHGIKYVMELVLAVWLSLEVDVSVMKLRD